MGWIALTVIVGGVVAAVLAIRGRVGRRHLDVGSVSDHWVAHHRADDPPR